MQIRALEIIEEILVQFRGFNEYTKALLTLTTVFGSTVGLYFLLKFIYKATIGLRLYMFSQYCCRGTDFVKKYGKWAVISGSTDGIGLAMAKELARRGHSIIIMGRSDEKLARCKETIEKEENVGELEAIKIDFRDASIENFNRIRPLIDPDNRDIGILINNVGFIREKLNRFHKNSIDDLVNSVNVNILSAIHLTRMIMPGMLERQRGLILNNSSVMGNTTHPFTNLYSNTKVFLSSFTKALQMEYASSPIDIVLLTPGPVHTKLLTDTQTFRGPSIMVPRPEEYTKSAINCLSTGINKFSGTAIHGLFSLSTKIGGQLNLIPMAMWFLSKIFTKGLQMSPVMKRKNKKQTPTAHANDQPNEGVISTKLIES